jgi:methionine--tRNA ligase beta chain
MEENVVKPEINIEDLHKADIRVGTIISAKEIEGSEKLVELQVDFGEIGQRQILTGIKMFYKPEEFVGLQLPFIVNLKPRKMMGKESQGMLLAVGDEKPVFLLPRDKVQNGSIVL